MKKITILIWAIAINSFSQVEPCEDYICDSLAVRAILDSNGLTDKSVNSVVRSASERIDILSFHNLGLQLLPPEIGQLTALTGLNLDNNQLTSLPPEIGQLTALENLSIITNQLTSLPSEIGQLTALKVIYLSNNRLTSLPPEIGQLTALLELYLSFNRLTSLPLEIVNLSPIQEFEFDSNYICSLPDSIKDWMNDNGLDYRNEIWREMQDCSSEGCADTDYLEYNPNVIVHIQDSCKTLSIGNKFNKAVIPDFQYNIFNNSITITFRNPTADKSLSIYTITGTLLKQFRTSGNTITWNVNESGVYYIKAVIDGKSIIKKVLL